MESAPGGRPRRLFRLTPLVAAAASAGILVACSSSPVSIGPSSSASHNSLTTAAPSSTAATTTTTTVPPPPPYEPPRVKPRISPPLPGEGKWRRMDRWATGPPSVLTTTFRPDASQPGIVAYVAWIRSTTTQFALYLGYEGPGPTALNRGPEMVPRSGLHRLLATFNSGFYEKDSAGGFYTHGTSYFPMIKGLATVVSYKDGTVDIVDWHGGARPGPNVLDARQNLPLLVNGAAPTPAAAIGSRWGITLGGVPAVWRTGLGIDAKGNLIYVAAASQTAESLAKILVDVGAVRAMELDINPEWPILITYGGPGAADPSIFVPNPASIPTRFLFPATKDFFAVYLRKPGVTRQPW